MTTQSQTQSTNVEGEVYRIGGEIQPPRLVRRIAPKFPVLAPGVKLLGYPVAEATTDANGNVVDVRLLRGFKFDPTQPQSEFDDAFLEAIRQWKYEPVYVDGKPQPVVFTVTINF